MGQLLEIHQFLTLSTAHLDGPWFGPGAELPTASVALDYGMLLWVPDDIDDFLIAADEPGPDHDPTIVALRRFARHHGCDWIMLDQDGPVVQGLQTFDW